MTRKLVLLSILPLLLLGVACDDDDPTRPSEPPPFGIEFTTPVNGDSVAAGPLFIRVDITGLRMNCNAVGGAHVDGEGHWHVYLDGAYQAFSCTDNVTIDLTGVSSGKHTLVASLRQNNHEPYDHHSGLSPYEPYVQLDSDDIISINVQ